MLPVPQFGSLLLLTKVRFCWGVLGVSWITTTGKGFLSHKDYSFFFFFYYSYYNRTICKWWVDNKMCLYSQLIVLYYIVCSVFLHFTSLIFFFTVSWFQQICLWVISNYSFKKHLRLELPINSPLHNLTVAVVNCAVAQETNSCKNGWVLLLAKIFQQIFVEYFVDV